MKHQNQGYIHDSIGFGSIIIAVALFVFLISSCVNQPPRLHEPKEQVKNYVVSIGTCPVVQTVKHPRKHSKYLHPANCNRAQKWEIERKRKPF